MKQWAGIVLFLAWGCVAMIPYEVIKDVDRKISFEDIKKDPDVFTGKKVVLGGEIIETQALKDGTQIEILQKPLDYYCLLYTSDAADE